MKNKFIRLIARQPLVHFLVIGIGIFVLFDLSGARDTTDSDASTIIVDRDRLLTFMQYRARAFDGQRFEDMLDAMSDKDKQRLVDELVREEVLYREARLLKLDKDDYIIRRRLIQKLEYITRGFVDADVQVSNQDIQNYYEQHKQEYYEEPQVTFTHVFLDKNLHGQQQAETLAQTTLQQLNEQAINFADAVRYGDRFLYHANYVERTPGLIASHFGAAMAQAIFGLTPDAKHWTGPYESPYGFHLVLVTGKKPGRFPDLAAIQSRVKEDAQRAFTDEKTEAAIRQIIQAYNVKVDLKLNPAARNPVNINRDTGKQTGAINST